jgi:hypothetical protein
VDIGGPAAAEQAGGRQLDQEVPQRCRVEHAGIEEDGVAGQANSPSTVPAPEPTARPAQRRGTARSRS